MDNLIKLQKISIINNRIEYFFSAPPKFMKYVSDNEYFFYMEYPNGYDLSLVPESILNVPFVGCMLTVSMLINVPIHIKSIDKTFYESLPKIKEAYRKMYPYAKMNFSVKADTIVDNTYEENNSSALFFTGGLDATSALATIIKQKENKLLYLINIWGGDIPTKDISSHNNLELYLHDLSQKLNINYLFIKSNVREIFGKEIKNILHFKILPWQSHGWWDSIAHILAMSSLVATIAFTKKIHYFYFGSSYPEMKKINSANNKDLLNALEIASCSFVSVDTVSSRIKKAENIIQFANENNLEIRLKVCWNRKDGENCSKCEKCYRTILDIYSNGEDPNKFGFLVTSNTFNEIKTYLENHYVNSFFWKEIKSEFLKNPNKWITDKNVSWFMDIKINPFKVVIKNYCTKLKNIFINKGNKSDTRL